LLSDRPLPVVAQYSLNNLFHRIAGPIAFAFGVVISIWLFSNQKYYTGLVPKHNGNFGDLAFPVGFVLAFVIYYALGAKKVKAES
jgi:purine-cytosine permease-like protein